MLASDLILEKLLPHFKAELDLEPRDSGYCEVTGEYCEKGYIVRTVNKKNVVQCESLRIFTLRSAKLIGIAQGTFEKVKVAQCLADYLSAHVVIPVEGQPELWVGGSYVNKVSPSSPFKVVAKSGGKAYAGLLDDDRPALVVQNTVRKELWFNCMRVGDKNNLMIATDTGIMRIPRQGWSAFKEAYLAVDKKYKGEVLVVLRGLNSGTISTSSDRFQKLYNVVPDFFQQIKEALPSDPYARDFYYSAITGVEVKK